MRPVRPFRPEARWIPLVRQLAGHLTLLAAAVVGTAIALGWAVRQQPVVVELKPDSTVMALYPVCATGDLLWFPQRQIRRRRTP